MGAKTCGTCRLYGANFYGQHSQPNTTCCADAVMDLPASFIPSRQTMKPDEAHTPAEHADAAVKRVFAASRTEQLLRELAASIREDIGGLPTGVLTLGEEVRAARERTRMSLQEVADASGFTKSHVWEIEKGRARNPTIGMVAGLSKALGVPFHRLAQAALNTSEALPPAPQNAGGE